MRQGWIYRRGDVYMADCGHWNGSVQGGLRPVIVVQNDMGNRYSPTLCVVKLTSKVDKKPNQPTHHELRGIRGLPKRSLALAEQLHTINKRDIIRYMGHLPPDEMDEIDRCIEAELDFASYEKGDVLPGKIYDMEGA